MFFIIYCACCMVLLTMSLVESASLPPKSFLVANQQMTKFDFIWKDLETITVERTPGTKGHDLILSYLEKRFSYNKKVWSLTFDTFEEATPTGTHSFTNIILTLGNPRSKKEAFELERKKRIILSAHWDSLSTATIPGFVGACDSAVPVAILMNLVDSLTPALKASDERFHWSTDPEKPTLQIVLFDGEEAMKKWSGTDNTYGSRHLANKWSEEGAIETIDVLLLLDLLGTGEDEIPMYHRNDRYHYQRLYQLNQLMKYHGLLKGEAFITGKPSYAGISDDHKHFQALGVPIVHLISHSSTNGFPEVWHTASDDLEHMSKDAIIQWVDLMRLYVSDQFNVGWSSTQDDDDENEARMYLNEEKAEIID